MTAALRRCGAARASNESHHSSVRRAFLARVRRFPRHSLARASIARDMHEQILKQIGDSEDFGKHWNSRNQC
jgi:hypothetical protein